MRYTCCGVYDMAVSAFGVPFFCKSRSEAVRMFGDAIRSGDKSQPMCNHPEDFALYELGFFEDSDGRFESLEMPSKLVDAASLKESDNG